MGTNWGIVWSWHNGQGLKSHVCALHPTDFPLFQDVRAQELLVTLRVPLMLGQPSREAGTGWWCWDWGPGLCGCRERAKGRPSSSGLRWLCALSGLRSFLSHQSSQPQELPQPNRGAGRHKPLVPSRCGSFFRLNTDPWPSQALGMAPIPREHCGKQLPWEQSEKQSKQLSVQD